jgi:hypothetical protein
MKQDDLLNKLGTKTSVEGATKVAPSQTSENVNSTSSTSDNDGTKRGTDLLGGVTTKSDSKATQTNTEVKDTNSASNTKVEPSGSATNTDTADWTLENALKEIKKLREENKATRVKYSESVENLRKETDVKVSAKEQELQELVSKAQELEQIKLKEEDRKRDLSEKLANREAIIADLKAKTEAEKKLLEEKMQKYAAQVEQYRAESEAQLEVYKQRLTSELSNIPEKYKDIAQTLVKGAGDPRDALVMLNEAKLRGLFEDKVVVVSHGVPGAADGARATKEKLDAAAQAQREKLSSMEKIREGLKQVRSAEGNSAFKIR